MDVNLYSWLVSVAIANGLWIIIFKSPLVAHVLSRYIEEELETTRDVENYLMAQRLWFAHNLWVCAVCQAVWTSAAATIIFVVLVPSWFWGAPLTFLATLPVIKWTQKHL